MIIQTTKKVIAGVVSYGTVVDTTGEKMLTSTGAKISYKGGGWWRINGYSNTDDKTLVDAIKVLKVRGVPCEDCGKISLYSCCSGCKMDRKVRYSKMYW